MNKDDLYLLDNNKLKKDMNIYKKNNFTEISFNCIS